MSFQQICFVGNIGKDPETRYTNNGLAVTEFSVAVNEYQKNGETHTEWFQVKTYGKLAERVGEHRHKGDLVAVSGRQRTDHWKSQTGEARSKTYIIAERCNPVGPKRAEGRPAQQHGTAPARTAPPEQQPSHAPKPRTPATQQSAPPDFFDDDLPF